MVENKGKYEYHVVQIDLEEKKRIEGKKRWDIPCKILDLEFQRLGDEESTTLQVLVPTKRRMAGSDDNGGTHTSGKVSG